MFEEYDDNDPRWTCFGTYESTVCDTPIESPCPRVDECKRFQSLCETQPQEEDNATSLDN